MLSKKSKRWPGWQCPCHKYRNSVTALDRFHGREPPGLARDHSIPIVLDPVGAGATRFRTETARRLIDEAPVAVLRGNASEILAVAGHAGDHARRGFRSRQPEDARLAALDLAKNYGIVVAVTGAEDFVTDGLRTAGSLTGIH